MSKPPTQEEKLRNLIDIPYDINIMALDKMLDMCQAKSDFRLYANKATRMSRKIESVIKELKPCLSPKYKTKT